MFSTALPTEQADALLCDWAPHPELFTFPRRKAWYCCEPQCQFNYLEQGTWPNIRKQLAPEEFLFHGHPDPRFRVPHTTHFGPLEPNTNRNRQDRAIAVVSNHGGYPWKRHPDIAYRNRVVSHPNIDLFGRSSWNRYRKNWYSWPKAPSNYKGEIPGDWPAEEKRNLQASYKVAVCLENMNEPYYFTEKFVEAVIAGCIPVYRAHETVRDTVLRGAVWAEASSLASKHPTTVALEMDLVRVQKANLQWLESKALGDTHAKIVYSKIASILCE